MNKKIWIAVGMAAAILGTGCMGMDDRRDMGGTAGSGGMGSGSMSRMDNGNMGSGRMSRMDNGNMGSGYMNSGIDD